MADLEWRAEGNSEDEDDKQPYRAWGELRADWKTPDLDEEFDLRFW